MFNSSLFVILWWHKLLCWKYSLIFTELIFHPRGGAYTGKKGTEMWDWTQIYCPIPKKSYRRKSDPQKLKTAQNLSREKSISFKVLNRRKKTKNDSLTRTLWMKYFLSNCCDVTRIWALSILNKLLLKYDIKMRTLGYAFCYPPKTYTQKSLQNS